MFFTKVAVVIIQKDRDDTVLIRLFKYGHDFALMVIHQIS